MWYEVYKAALIYPFAIFRGYSLIARRSAKIRPRVKHPKKSRSFTKCDAFGLKLLYRAGGAFRSGLVLPDAVQISSVSLD